MLPLELAWEDMSLEERCCPFGDDDLPLRCDEEGAACCCCPTGTRGAFLFKLGGGGPGGERGEGAGGNDSNAIEVRLAAGVVAAFGKVGAKATAGAAATAGAGAATRVVAATDAGTTC